MRILFLSPNQSGRWNRGHQLFRDEIARQHEVIFVGDGYDQIGELKSPYNVPEILDLLQDLDFDFIMTYGLKYTYPYYGLDKVTDIPKVQFICDFVPAIAGYQGTITPYCQFFERDKYDIYFSLSVGVIRSLEHRGFGKEDDNVFFLPFGVDTNLHFDQEKPRPIDVMTSSSKHDAIYPLRNKLEIATKELGVKHFGQRVFGDTFINTMNNSKIGVNALSIYKRMNMKIPEVMACGALCFTDYPEEFDRLGFKDGKHLVIYDNINDYKEKVIWYLEDEAKLTKIAKAGQKYVTRYHSNAVRVKEMTKCLTAWI
jgi:hypothetical protein